MPASRRKMLGAGIGAITAPPASASVVVPDAEVIRLVNDVLAAERACRANIDKLAPEEWPTPAWRAAQRALIVERDAAMDALADAVPATLRGFCMKACAAFVMASRHPDGDTISNGPDDYLALSVVQDLVDRMAPGLRRQLAAEFPN